MNCNVNILEGKKKNQSTLIGTGVVIWTLLPYGMMVSFEVVMGNSSQLLRTGVDPYLILIRKYLSYTVRYH